MSKINISGVIGGFEVPGLTPNIEVGAIAGSEHPTDYLKKFHTVRGVITSSPTDLPQRFQKVTDALVKDGWRVIVKEDPATSSGLPGVHPFVLLMYHPERSALRAQTALVAQLVRAELLYSAIASTAGEVVTEVVVPTVQQAGEGAKKSAPWVLAGLGVAALLLLTRR